MFYVTGRWLMPRSFFVAVDVFQHCFIGLQSLYFSFSWEGQRLIEGKKMRGEIQKSITSGPRPVVGSPGHTYINDSFENTCVFLNYDFLRLYA